MFLNKAMRTLHRLFPLLVKLIQMINQRMEDLLKHWYMDSLSHKAFMTCKTRSSKLHLLRTTSTWDFQGKIRRGNEIPNIFIWRPAWQWHHIMIQLPKNSTMGIATFKRRLLLSHNKFVFQNNVNNNWESSLFHLGAIKKRSVMRNKGIIQRCQVQKKSGENPEIWYWIHICQKHSHLPWLPENYIHNDLTIGACNIFHHF